MNEIELESRAEQVENPFIRALRAHPRFDASSVTRHDSGMEAQVPGVAVTALQGEERLDHGGDSWGFTLTITARRNMREDEALDKDAAAIEYVTTTAMGGDPNISLLIVEEGIVSVRESEGKVRLFTMELPVLVVFS